jgi:hypothetical protein
MSDAYLLKPLKQFSIKINGKILHLTFTGLPLLPEGFASLNSLGICALMLLSGK